MSSHTEARKHSIRSGTIIFHVERYSPFTIYYRVSDPYIDLVEQSAPREHLEQKNCFHFTGNFSTSKNNFFFHTPVIIGGRNILNTSVILPLPVTVEFSSYFSKNDHISQVPVSSI